MDKQSEDKRSRTTEVALPEAKCRRTTVDRGTVNQCTDLIVHPSIQISVDISDTFFKAFQHGQRVDRCCGFFEDDSGQNQTAAELRDLVHNLSLEQLKSKELFNSFKTHSRRQYLQLIKDRDRDLAELSSELTSTRLSQLDAVRNSWSDVNSSFASLSSHLAEVVAHLKRAGDVKKGEGGSRAEKVKVAVEGSADGSESLFFSFEESVLRSDFSSCT
ncbi:hypothetical protein F511_12906 [Dorcoceras hygrometricum]|uniref:Uncharacterized protein n=1 Tax=Dorcoceras hygrometricum TaxID=472368 RepID=A0A2Z7CSG5_9LAMI|nr:hypothetical protein F511_12906 [Dorcoceras hygrometricum]